MMELRRVAISESVSPMARLRSARSTGAHFQVGARARPGEAMMPLRVDGESCSGFHLVPARTADFLFLRLVVDFLQQRGERGERVGFILALDPDADGVAGGDAECEDARRAVGFDFAALDDEGDLSRIGLHGAGEFSGGTEVESAGIAEDDFQFAAGEIGFLLGAFGRPPRWWKPRRGFPAGRWCWRGARRAPRFPTMPVSWRSRPMCSSDLAAMPNTRRAVLPSFQETPLGICSTATRVCLMRPESCGRPWGMARPLPR